MSKVWAVLPVFNEIRNIRGCLDALRLNLAGEKFTICVVDGGSTDGTLAVVDEYIQKFGDEVYLVHQRKETKEKGRGRAVQLGLRHGVEKGFSVFVEIDGDLSQRPEELPTGIRLIRQGYEVAISSKYLPESKTVNRELVRRVISYFGTAWIRFWVGTGLTDCTNSYRFYDFNTAKLIAFSPIKGTGPLYVTESLLLCLQNDLRIVEFPACYVGRVEGEGSVTMRDVVRSTLTIPWLAAKFHWERLQKKLSRPEFTVTTGHLVGFVSTIILTLWLLFEKRREVLDTLGLYNPVYMRHLFGKITYPAHGWMNKFTAHPPTHYLIVAKLLDFGFTPFYAESIPILCLILLCFFLLSGKTFARKVKIAFYLGLTVPAVTWFVPDMRPDLVRGYGFIAAFLALEKGRLQKWDVRFLFLGSALLVLSSTLHYPGHLAWLGVFVYFAWSYYDRQKKALMGAWPALILGGLVVGLPYLFFFVIPNFTDVMHMTTGIAITPRHVARSGFDHLRMYQVFLENFTGVHWAKAVLFFPMYLYLPLFLILFPALYRNKDTKGIALASSPLLLFHLFLLHAHHLWSSGYAVPEFILYVVSLALWAEVLGERLGKRFTGIGNVVFPATAICLLTLEAILYFGKAPISLGRNYLEAELARAASKTILGDNALIGSRNAALFYACGSAHYHSFFNLNPMGGLSESVAGINLKEYFEPYSAICEFSDDSQFTENERHESIVSWYLDGTLSVRGFYFTWQSPTLNFLMLNASNKFPLEGFVNVDSNTMLHLHGNPTGSMELASYVVEHEASKSAEFDSMLHKEVFALPQKNESDPKKDLVVTLSEKGKAPKLPTARPTLTLDASVVRPWDLLKRLEGDRPIQFYLTRSDAVAASQGRSLTSLPIPIQ